MKLSVLVFSRNIEIALIGLTAADVTSPQTRFFLSFFIDLLALRCAPKFKDLWSQRAKK